MAHTFFLAKKRRIFLKHHWRILAKIGSFSVLFSLGMLLEDTDRPIDFSNNNNNNAVTEQTNNPQAGHDMQLRLVESGVVAVTGKRGLVDSSGHVNVEQQENIINQEWEDLS